MSPLMVLFLLPFLFSLFFFWASFVSSAKLKPIALFLSLIPLILLIKGWSGWIGMESSNLWFSPLNIYFHLKIDALSFVFLLLTFIIFPIALSVVPTHTKQASLLYGLIFILEGLLFGLFTAHDLAFFTLFWEATLLPLYFMIAIWGSGDKGKAATKFILYMIAGSALLVAAVLFLYFDAGNSFDFNVLKSQAEHSSYAPWVCLIFLLAFAVKTPLFPFHAWLPDTYYHASTTGTILLSALLSKAGVYGLLRINGSFFPSIMELWSPYLIAFAVAGVVYGGLAAWMQNDFKRLIAYSSFSHVNFILAGVFLMHQSVAYEGAILQSFNHGITITGLFLVAFWLSERVGTQSMTTYQGVAAYLPLLCWITFVFVLSSIALPGTNNFVGEIVIFYALFGQHPWMTVILAFTVILSVLYMLKWMQTTYFGRNTHREHYPEDLKSRQLLIATPLILLVFWIGLYPSTLLNEIKPAEKLLEKQQ